MDKRCYDEYGLTEDILMEHAADGMIDYINAHLKDANSIIVVCGVGNNGADGLVLARLLQFDMSSVKVYLPLGVKSTMAKLQLSRVQKLNYVEIIDELCEADIIVDAIFGAGLNRPLDSATESIIEQMNDLNGFKLACDIPTGITEDGQITSVAFDADATVTMGAKKESLYADGVKDTVGDVVRVDLGIRYNQYTKDMPASSYLLDADDIELPNRDFSKSTHKGSFGHATLLCGDKIGASIIAGMASTRFGAGLTTLVTGESFPSHPYLMTSPHIPHNTTALAVGMGMGESFDNKFLKRNIIESRLPIVLDADGFNHAELLGILEQREREVVITPHPKEFASLWNHIADDKITTKEVQSKRFEMTRRFNALYPHITLLLKGANSLIIHQDKLYINPLGSPKLSKGGSGDVLSGLIVALLAQGYSAIDAAIQGSLALALASENYKGASYSMIATDLIDEITKLTI